MELLVSLFCKSVTVRIGAGNLLESFSDGIPYLRAEILVLEFNLTNAALLGLKSGDWDVAVMGVPLRNESEGRIGSRQKV
jgi:hypothetical protein